MVAGVHTVVVILAMKYISDDNFISVYIAEGKLGQHSTDAPYQQSILTAVKKLEKCS